MSSAHSHPSERCAISHFGIQVADLQRSLAFYRDLIGLEVVREAVLDDEVTRALVGYPTAILNVALLRLPQGAAYLEIIQYEGVAGVPVDAATVNPGTCHLCFHVEDLAATYQRLTEAGVASVSAVLDLKTQPFVGSKVVYMIDPDGVRVELLDSDPYDVTGELRTGS